MPSTSDSIPSSENKLAQVASFDSLQSEIVESPVGFESSNPSPATTFHSLPGQDQGLQPSSSGDRAENNDSGLSSPARSTMTRVTFATAPSGACTPLDEDASPDSSAETGRRLPTMSGFVLSPRNGPSPTLRRKLQQRVTSYLVGSRLSLARDRRHRMTIALKFVDPMQEDRYLRFAARINQVPVRFFAWGLVIPTIVLVLGMGPVTLMSLHQLQHTCPSISGHCYECNAGVLLAVTIISAFAFAMLAAPRKTAGQRVHATRRKMSIFIAFMGCFMCLKFVGTMCPALCDVVLTGDLDSPIHLNLLDSSLTMTTICAIGRHEPLSKQLVADAQWSEASIQNRNMLASLFLFIFLTISTITVRRILFIAFAGFLTLAVAYGALSGLYTSPSSSLLWIVLLSLAQDLFASIVLIFQRELLSRVSFLFVTERPFFGLEGTSSMAIFLKPLPTLYRNPDSRAPIRRPGRRWSVADSISGAMATFRERFGKGLSSSSGGISFISAKVRRASTGQEAFLPSETNYNTATSRPTWIGRFLSRRRSEGGGPASVIAQLASPQPAPPGAHYRRISASLTQHSTLSTVAENDTVLALHQPRRQSSSGPSVLESHPRPGVGLNIVADVAHALKLTPVSDPSPASPPNTASHHREKGHHSHAAPPSSARHLLYVSPTTAETSPGPPSSSGISASSASNKMASTRSFGTQENIRQSQGMVRASTGSVELTRQPTLTLLDTPATPATVVRTTTAPRNRSLTRRLQDQARDAIQSLFYEFPDEIDEERYQASYHVKMQKRVKAVLAVNTATAAVSFIGVTLLRASSRASAEIDLYRWMILDSLDLIVNITLLAGVLLVSSKYLQVSEKHIEVVSVIYVVMTFAAAMTNSIALRRLQVEDRPSIQLSNHRVLFSYFAMTTLRLRPRLHLSIVGLALLALPLAAWAFVPEDRLVDMFGIAFSSFLAGLGSMTLCLMFESAARRYFWLKHCVLNATLAAEKLTAQRAGIAGIAALSPNT
ncbi:hypothetical protein BCR44DRAFT_350895 [Catenaria anguillulae PL171]|uniref:Uncharacterized protein n=1 Tax=Catenaria anguillulae PL171 TaxID=765915 RepID=A0A1Y2HBL6_9FUNG|nr:hypothetical protein BCR44DRAFT_350895 [Catenaria anguillulae PL171]